MEKVNKYISILEHALENYKKLIEEPNSLTIHTLQEVEETKAAIQALKSVNIISLFNLLRNRK